MKTRHAESVRDIESTAMATCSEPLSNTTQHDATNSIYLQGGLTATWTALTNSRTQPFNTCQKKAGNSDEESVNGTTCSWPALKRGVYKMIGLLTCLPAKGLTTYLVLPSSPHASSHSSTVSVCQASAAQHPSCTAAAAAASPSES